MFRNFVFSVDNMLSTCSTTTTKWPWLFSFLQLYYNRKTGPNVIITCFLSLSLEVPPPSIISRHTSVQRQCNGGKSTKCWSISHLNDLPSVYTPVFIHFNDMPVRKLTQLFGQSLKKVNDFLLFHSSYNSLSRSSFSFGHFFPFVYQTADN